MWRLMRCGWRGGVVVEWWLSKITKVKEKRYLKINSSMNHMKPSIQQVGANYTSTYRDI